MEVHLFKILIFKKGVIYLYENNTLEISNDNNSSEIN